VARKRRTNCTDWCPADLSEPKSKGRKAAHQVAHWPVSILRTLISVRVRAKPANKVVRDLRRRRGCTGIPPLPSLLVARVETRRVAVDLPHHVFHPTPVLERQGGRFNKATAGVHSVGSSVFGLPQRSYRLSLLLRRRPGKYGQTSLFLGTARRICADRGESISPRGE